ncbi:dUTP diphosphatase [Chryseomicrobium palamuruense]|uniref:dUTP diphosphatase n=1 Tax=Chryseomicrobium palamuruense TaxID=682973 RepID=A0ABV8UZG8_9BACL
MNLTKLFQMQRDLDRYIEKQRDIQNDVFERKVVALYVELGELANETRCFKFWSSKGPSAKEVILEEYVDSIHFLLSLGLEKEWHEKVEVWPPGRHVQDLTEGFLITYEAIAKLRIEPTLDRYQSVWEGYAEIARQLGFTTDEVTEAYYQKNEINYARQQSGY